MKENTNEKRDDLAAIGIGAMIVFIALILVASVAAAVIISTAEKLQQNAQNTGAETTNMLSSKVIVISVMVIQGDDLYITFELAPGSANIAPVDIDYAIVCSNGAVYGTFTDASLVGNDATLPGTALLEPHTTYDLTLDSAVISDCEPAANEDHSLVIQSVYGGYTFEILNYGSDVSPGSVVV
jgi:flagellin FlaB